MCSHHPDDATNAQPTTQEWAQALYLGATVLLPVALYLRGGWWVDYRTLLPLVMYLAVVWYQRPRVAA